MSLTGTWHLSIATPMGEQKFELDLIQDGPDQISGVSRYESQGEQALPEPKLKGNTVTWKQRITQPLKVNASMELIFDGDVVTGTAKAGIFPAKIVGRRAA